MASRLMLVLILLALPVLPEAQIQFALFLFRAKSFLRGVNAGFKAYDYIQKAYDSRKRPGNTRPITSPEGFTLFWPTDDAFSRLSPITLQSLTDEDEEQIIYAHTVPSYITFPLDSSSPITLKTLVPGVNITIYGDASPYYVSSAKATSRVLAYDESLQNPCAAYAIDTVLYVPTPVTGDSTVLSGGGFLLGAGVACFGLLLYG